MAKKNPNKIKAGFYNEGKGNTFVNVKTKGYEVGFLDRGESTVVIGGEHTAYPDTSKVDGEVINSKNPQNNKSSPGGRIIAAILLIAAIATIIGVGWQIFYANTAPTNVNVTGNGNATAVGPNAQAIVNQQAKFSLDNKTLQGNNMILTISAGQGILPTQLCITVSTDVEVTDFQPMMSGTFQYSGDRQSQMCLQDPPKNLTLEYMLNSKPSYFNVTLQ